ncbi:MAG: lipopolysaccharide biosynthesis protein [Pseudomonadota bacterium]|nr:lipopolysaccharide biosynthesis protein [Pseudomonadota bacterium]
MIKGPIALGTIRTSFALGLRLLIQAGTLLLVARMLGPQNFGLFAGVTSLAVLLGTLSTFGTQFVLLGEMSRDPSQRDNVLSYAIPTTLLCGLLLLVLYQALVRWILPSGAIPWQALLAIGLTEVLLQPIFGLMATEHHALGRVARAQLMRNSPLALRLLTACCIFFFSLSPALSIYAGGYLAASVLVLLLGRCCSSNEWPRWRLWRLPSFTELHYAFGYAATNASRAGPAELDKTLAVKLLSVDAAGVYAAGARVVAAVVLPITAMTLSALPRLFRDVKKPSGSKRLLRSMYWVALLYSLALSSVLWLSAPMLETLFGQTYQGMCEVIRWLCLAVPGNALRLVGGNVLMAMGRPWFRVGFEVVGLSMLIVAGFSLVPSMGSKGMILAVVCAEWCMAAIAGAIIIKTNESCRCCERGAD